MQSISDDDLYRRLAFDNPCWEFTSGIETKPRNPTKRDLFPAFCRRVQERGGGDGLVLAGSVGVGKTVMLRQVVARLIETGVAPAAVLYCSLAAPLYTGIDLSRLLEIFTSRHGHGPESGLYLFFDEVQYARDWRRQFQALAAAWPMARLVGAVSSGAPAITTAIATAITSKVPPSGAGISTFVLPPLTFPEFMRFRGVEEKLFGKSQAGSALKLQEGAIGELNAEFHRYVNTGGFVEGFTGDGTQAPAFLLDGAADRVLHKDLAGLHGINDSQELNRLFGLLAKNTAREVSIEGLTKAMGVAKNTIRKYLDYLEHAFLIRRLPRVDRWGKRFKRAVAFKVYLTSPCLYAALFGPVEPGDEVFPRLAETALVSQWLGSEAAATLAYASWRGGAIDLLSLSPDGGKPSHVFEIDWSDDYAADGKKADKGPRHLAAFVETTNRNAKTYVLTHESTRQGTIGGIGVTLVPLSLYAYWLARDPTVSGFHAGN